MYHWWLHTNVLKHYTLMRSCCVTTFQHWSACLELHGYITTQLYYNIIPVHASCRVAHA